MVFRSEIRTPIETEEVESVSCMESADRVEIRQDLSYLSNVSGFCYTTVQPQRWRAWRFSSTDSILVDNANIQLSEVYQPRDQLAL